MSGYDITKIPGIMRGKGWEKGAALMDGWFARPENDKPEDGRPDTTTITMAWTLGYRRAKQVYDQMIAERIWVNAAAQREIKKWLTQSGTLTRQETRFGGPMHDVVRLDKTYIQLRGVGGVMDESDDMKAALGRFTFRVAVAGKAVPERTTGYSIEIEQIGIYVRDSYDFIGDQGLGYWSDTDFAGGWNPIQGTAVGNADFQAWRAANHRGGDYIVYSDVKILQGGPQDVFKI